MKLDAIPHLLPRSGAPSPLYIYLHGTGGAALAMTPVADQFAQAYPQAAHLLPEGLVPPATAAGARERLDRDGVDDPGWAPLLGETLPALGELVEAAQRELGVTRLATALVGFAEGAIVALEAAQAYPGLVGRVVAIAGRYATLPATAPHSVIHLVHGKDDRVIAARHTIDAATRLLALKADVTADVVPGIGHLPHPALVERALGHLQSFLPRSVWEEALASAPIISTRADSRDLGRPVSPPAANDPA